MTARTVIDAHHHLWDPAARRYRFLQAPQLAPIRRRFDAEELGRTVRPHGIAQTVVVQAAPALEETEALLTLAGAEPLIAGVVGWIDADADDPIRRSSWSGCAPIAAASGSWGSG